MRKKIILHWTAGTNKICATDYQHYHYIIDGDGEVKTGKFPVSANEVCKTDSNNKALYAAHCGGGNTGAIGVSMCGMYQFKNRKDVGQYPLTKIQCEKAFKLIAELAKQYKIPVTPQTIMTHYEFDCSRGKAGRKIDIIYLPPYPDIVQEEVGNFIRSKITWYLSKI